MDENVNIHDCEAEAENCTCGHCHSHEEEKETLFDKETECHVILEDTAEDVVLSREEYQYILDILERQEDDFAKYYDSNAGDDTIYLSNGWRDDIDYDDLADMLFAMHKRDEAWEVIEKYYENIDYHYIISTKYAQLKVSSPVFSKLYDEGQLNDHEFGYYLIINNDCNNDFWKNQFKNCKKATDLLDAVAYFFAYPDIPPINPVNSYIEDKFIELCSPQDKLDNYLFGMESKVKFTTPMIKAVIDNEAVTSVNITRIYGIYHLLLINNDEGREDAEAELTEFWKGLDGEYAHRIEGMDIYSLEQIEDIVSRKEMIPYNTMMSMIFNSPYVLEYMEVILEMLKKNDIECPSTIGDIIKQSMLPYMIYFSKFSDIFKDINNRYIISESMGKLPIIYDTCTCLLAFNDAVYKYSDEVRKGLFGFVDEVIERGSIEKDNAITVKVFAEEYNSSYRCECGNVVGLEYATQECPTCHTVVTEREIDTNMMREKALRYKRVLDKIDSIQKPVTDLQ